MSQHTAKLFMNGRSQAVRLPREFRFEGKEVYIEKQGDAVLIKPKPVSMGVWLEQFYANHDPLPENFLADRNDAAPQHRDWFDEKNA